MPSVRSGTTSSICFASVMRSHSANVTTGPTLSEFTLMDRLKMLSQREQLMRDIDGIVEEFTQHNSLWIIEDDMEDLIRVLCNAVCKNFPAE